MKLTPDYIASQVLTCAFEYDGTHTTCRITTRHGSRHTGESACLDPANYNREIGEQIAHKNALDKLWDLEGYFINKLGLCHVPGQLTDADDLHFYTDEGYPLGDGLHHSQVTVRLVTKTEPKPANQYVIQHGDLEKSPEFGRMVVEAILANKGRLGVR
jgi:hypothetical protein